MDEAIVSDEGSINPEIMKMDEEASAIDIDWMIALEGEDDLS